ncbi:OsmC family protein [Pelagibacterium xiamenense]|uniref:OsmC family protein n=1 Tax=Pelagibacterium xiamenense TaxID=2901140 RepID=UPI001E410248|nr:OsmC family protein [Pelagibacterium xiamenense]MCD7059871.1 OsmC family protein [Pelagibacterium xiamenense]
MVKIVTRPTTVGATLPGKGQGKVKARAGAELEIAGTAGETGMTPVEMMDAALAGCLVLSVRIAARQRGWQDRLVSVDVDVQHEKAADGPSRVAKFRSAFKIEGDFSESEREALIADAHALCTVGNTLERGAEIVDVPEIEE